MTTLAYKRAKRGEALLDAKLPGWFLTVDLDTLNLGSSCSCVLGQLATDIVPRKTWFKRWVRGGPKPQYMEAVNALKLTDRQAVTHGFMEDFKAGCTVETLTEAWKVIIQNRQSRRRLSW